MARRKLTLQQRRRINDRQASVLDSVPTDDTGQSSGFGQEQEGLVIVRYGKQADVLPASSTPGQAPRRCHVRANLQEGDLVTGDRVIWRDGQPTGVIEAIEKRGSLLCRPDNRGNLRPVAANIDRIGIVIAPEPAPHANLIDRYLVAAHNQGITPFIIFNKIDLPSADTREMAQLLRDYEQLGYPLFRVSGKQKCRLTELGAYLSQCTSVLVGQSGVGKSSLINALVPDAGTAVKDLSETAAKGRHTTTAATLFQLPEGGWLIDSPGIREFGLWHLDPRRVADGFIEFRPYLGHCRFRDCLHLDEPGCAISAAVTDRTITPVRMASYRQIVNSLTCP